ncbi:MAG: DNA polymerase III subunit alpha [Bacteroidia bacterium]|nr:DNA polymerase III subunit alpha [Bacteroidia bacterium]MDW8158144.1 DNA polymerase III subunit alpha [Bacteroidia bacterium]
MPEFCHLHNHTEFSLLDGAAKIEQLIQKACNCNMKAIAISDHGNLYGVPKFVLTARKNGIRPIIGEEFYICGGKIEQMDKNNPIYHQILFAKTEEGYKNLIKLSSIAFKEGFYYKPRIDKELLQKYSKGLIATTCCLASEINRTILDKGQEEAEKLFLWYLDVFGEDYYIEIQRHGLADQNFCNEVLLRWAKKYNVPIIATNDVHYVDREDSEAHDLLLALQTNSEYSDTKRFRFTDDNNNLCSEFYFKTPQEMQALFHDLPEALDNTMMIADKCSFEPNLNGDLFLPHFPIPAPFQDENQYLAHLTWQGARRRYKEITAELQERIERELAIIKQMGFAGYFLIVQEFTNEARKRNVFVGPGRGSAAGSVVAYCIGITDVDPMQYALLFERFLNPERISPPDIDIDFDDEGRQAVIDFVIERYGQECVSQIITFGTMGAKTAIRDVGRALGIPLAEVNRIAKYIPEKPGMTFEKALDPEENPEGYLYLKEAFESKDPNIQKMMRYAKTLEGTARHTGIHAAGVIIAPGDITNYAPTAISKDKVVTTQFDGPSAELAGLLKMDFLGLKTLSIIKTALQLIEARHGKKIDIDNIDLNDPKTYELYQHGETIATFQFESDGMRKYLRQLKPTNIEDLIAMNALYRPGPMDNIPLFIDRKHGRQPIEYLHPKLEPILKNTYGIMVYQEQIMQIARELGGYTLGGADLLRRAMGKKKKDVMEKERSKFVEGAKKNGIDEKTAVEIFSLMEKFAEYGFNKSHSVAYSILAFRTAYLKAHFPSEYMAAVLSHNLDSIEKISFFIEECRRMNINILPPCVNQSEFLFSVEGDKIIRFGLGAIKGLGEPSAKSIIEERKKNGPFTSIFQLTARIPSKLISRKTLECLIKAGALDAVNPNINRAQYFQPISKTDNTTPIEQAINYGQKKQSSKNSHQVTLFEIDSNRISVEEPTIPYVEDWPLITKLNYEKEMIGFYLSAHPLDKYKMLIKSYTNTSIRDISNFIDKEVRIAGIVTAAHDRLSKKGTKFGTYTIEDYSGALEFSLFSEEYARFKGFFEINNCIYILGNYVPSFRGADTFELKIRDIRLLDSLLETTEKDFIVEIPLQQITPPFVETLEKLFKNFKGKCTVKFKIFDNNIQPIILQARNVMVKPEHGLAKALESLKLDFYLK